jgi:hypothetical protein
MNKGINNKVLDQYHKVILTDADGVLLNWGYAFDVWMTEKGYTAVNKLKYNIGEIYGITQTESKKTSQRVQRIRTYGICASSKRRNPVC